MASDNIQVVIRVRPLIKREKTDGSKILWHTQDNQIIQKDGNYNFPFDRVFSQQHSTDDVYNHLQPLIESVMDGFNGTVFAYGQTASGKTFTMTGNRMYPGVIPLAVEEIFSSIDESPDREFLIRVSYMEIYNENVVDLLGDVRKHLEVRENASSNIFVENLTEQIVTSSEQIYDLMRSGEVNRHYGSTNMNEQSSRSHTIFRLIIESKELSENPQVFVEEGAVKVSALNLVDLAGSEKAKQTGATGQRLTEGAFINKSLLALTSVISQLSENAGFISYRDSKLTRILQNSLGGNSKTAIICNCTPAVLDETLSTLRFANRAKRIKNKPHVNEVLSEEALLRRYKKEISNLKKTLDTMKNTDIGNVQEEKLELQLRLAEEEKRRQDQESKINRLTELICVSNKIKSTGSTPKIADKRKRRETWCPGKARKSMALGILGTPKGFSSTLRQKRHELTTIDSPSEPIVRRARSDEDKFFRNVFGNSTICEESEESIEEINNDLIKKQVDFDLSYIPSRSPFVCDIECQTEDFQQVMIPETDTEKEKMAFKLEFITCELETKNQQITELQAEVAEKEDELATLNTNMEQAFDKNLKEEEALRSEVWELKKKMEELERNLGIDPSCKVEQLQEEKSLLEKELSEICNTMQQLIGDLDKSNTLKSIVEEKLLNSDEEGKRLTDELTHLKINYESLEESYRKREEELRDLEEFTQFENDYRNMSILEKQEAKRRLSSVHSNSSPLIKKGSEAEQIENLKKQVCDLEKDNGDSEALYLETKKQLATSKDETKLLDQELREMKKTLERFEKEKQDFDILMEMEQKKSQRREKELTEQLKQVYAEQGHSQISISGGDEDKIEGQKEELEALQCKLESLEKEIHSATEQGNIFKQERDGFEQDKNILIKKKEALIEENIILSSEKDTVTQENHVLSQEKNALKEEKNVLVQEKEVLEEEKRLLQEEMEEFKQDKDIFLHENDILTVEKTEVEKEKELLLEKILTLEEKVEKLSEERSSLPTKDLEKKINENGDTCVESKDKEIKKHEEFLTLREENMSLSTENSTLTNNIESLRKEINELNENIEVLKNENVQLNEEKAQLLTEKSEVVHIINEKQNMQENTEEPKSLFDELDDLTVGLTGMFPQKSLITNQHQSPGNSLLEQEAIQELQQDLEYQITQLKNELTSSTEKQVKIEAEKLLLVEERDSLHVKLEKLQTKISETEQLKQEIAEETVDKDSDKKDEYVQNSLAESVALLKSENIRLLELINTLQNQNNELNSEKEELEKLIHSLEQEKENGLKAKEGIDSSTYILLQQEKSELEKALNEMHQQNNNLAAKIKEVELESASSMEKTLDVINELKSENGVLKSRISQLQSEIDSIQKEMSEAVSEHVDETNDFINKLETAKDENIAVEERYMNELKDVEKLNAELKEEVVNLNEQSESRREELESLVYALEDEIKEKSTVIEEGKAYLCKCQSEIEQLKQKNCEDDTQIQEYITKLTETGNENSSLKLDNENLTHEIELMKARLSDSYSVSEEIEKLKGQIIEVREERESAVTSKKSLEQELEKYKADLTAVEADMKVTSEKLTQAKERVEVLESTIAKGHEMLQQYSQDMQELQNESCKYKEEKEELEQKYEALMDKYDGHLEELKADHESEVQGYVDKVEDLQNKHDSACAEYEEQLKGLLENKKEEIELEYSIQIKRLKQDLEDLKTSHSDVEAKLGAELVEKEQLLEGQLSEVRKKLEETEMEMCNKVLQLESKLDEQVKERENILREAQAEKNILQDQLDEWKCVIDDFNKEKEKDMQLIKDKDAEISKICQKMEQEKKWAEEEEQRLKKCCDEADCELEEVNEKYKALENEYDEYKKKMLMNTSQSFENAEVKYQKKFDWLKQQYEQEILRLKCKKEAASNDLDQSVCQLRDEKNKLVEMQTVLHMMETENEKLKSSSQLSNTRIQQLQKDLNFQIEYFKEETDHLRGCVDSAEYDLDKKTSECLCLAQELNDLKKQVSSQENTERLKKIEEEKESIARQLADQKMKMVMMSTQLMKAEDPYKKEIKYLKEENNHAKEQVQKLKNEVRRLKNNQPDDSVVFESNKTGRVAGSGVVNEVLRFTLEAEKHKLERELKLTQEEVQRLKKHYDSHRLIITDLKTQLTERDDKIFRFKKHYRKQLNSDEREALKDVVNSPKLSDKSHSRIQTPHSNLENKPLNDVNFLNMSSWLTKDSKQEEEPGKCNTQ